MCLCVCVCECGEGHPFIFKNILISISKCGWSTSPSSKALIITFNIVSYRFFCSSFLMCVCACFFPAFAVCSFLVVAFKLSPVRGGGCPLKPYS